MPLFALIGGVIGGSLIDSWGRKRTLFFTNGLFLACWTVTVLATKNSVWLIYLGRSIAGVGVGLASLILPIYLGEILEPTVRGSFGLLPTALGNLGILLCFVLGSHLGWKILATFGIVFSIPFLILLCFIPETPHWLISKGHDDRARKTLQKLRGSDFDVEPELKAMFNYHDEEENINVKSHLMNCFQKKDRDVLLLYVKKVFDKSNRKAIWISIGLMFFQQFSGINAVIYYTKDIFKLAGSSIDDNLCTIIIGVVNFISAFIATLVIDRLGRKILLYISSSAMIVALGILCIYFFMGNYTQISVHQHGWIPLASLVVYILGFSLGFGPIPWLMMGEILPARIKGFAASLVTAFNWTCTFLVTKMFGSLSSLLGIYVTFWAFLLFFLVCVASIFFVVFCVPETNGKSLEDIERILTGRKRDSIT